MKKIFLIVVLLIVWPCVLWADVDTLEGQELTTSANIEGVTTTDTVEGQAMASGCSSFTVDYHQDMEASDFVSSPPTGWTKTDASSKLSMSASGERTTISCFNGTEDPAVRGMAYDTSGTAVAYMQYGFSSSSDVSVGFWYKTPASIDNNLTAVILNIGGWLTLSHSAITPNELKITESDTSTGIDVSATTWYWISVDRVQNGTNTFRLYDSSGTIIESVTCSALNFAATYARIGSVTIGGGSGYSGSMYFDDFVFDNTSPPDPIGP